MTSLSDGSSEKECRVLYTRMIDISLHGSGARVLILGAENGRYVSRLVWRERGYNSTPRGRQMNISNDDGAS